MRCWETPPGVYYRGGGRGRSWCAARRGRARSAARLRPTHPAERLIGCQSAPSLPQASASAARRVDQRRLPGVPRSSAEGSCGGRTADGNEHHQPAAGPRSKIGDGTGAIWIVEHVAAPLPPRPWRPKNREIEAALGDRRRRAVEGCSGLEQGTGSAASSGLSATDQLPTGAVGLKPPDGPDRPVVQDGWQALGRDSRSAIRSPTSFTTSSGRRSPPDQPRARLEAPMRGLTGGRREEVRDVAILAGQESQGSERSIPRRCGRIRLTPHGMWSEPTTAGRWRAGARIAACRLPHGRDREARPCEVLRANSYSII